MREVGEKKVADISEYVRQLPFFADWSEKQLRDLCDSTSVKTYKNNDIVAKQGSASGSVCLIKKGTCRILKKIAVEVDWHPKDRGRRNTIAQPSLFHLGASAQVEQLDGGLSSRGVELKEGKEGKEGKDGAEGKAGDGWGDITDNAEMVDDDDDDDGGGGGASGGMEYAARRLEVAMAAREPPECRKMMTNKFVELCTLHAHDFFGEEAISKKRKHHYSCSLVAVGFAQILHISPSFLRRNMSPAVIEDLREYSAQKAEFTDDDAVKTALEDEKQWRRKKGDILSKLVNPKRYK